MRVPEVRKCCFCVPLRKGIIVFGVINIIFSVLSFTFELVSFSVLKSEDALPHGQTAVVFFFTMLGLGAVINVTLLVAACQKDMSLLRLYNYYAVLLNVAALLPALMLGYQGEYTQFYIAMFIIALQCYLILLVRSETVKLEGQVLLREGSAHNSDPTIDVPQEVTLI